jgi:hypothetical protein
MSGGSYDYVCFKIQETAGSIRNQESNPRRAAFAHLLHLVGEAMHDIEWVDSGDYGTGDENRAIDACFEFCKQAYKAAAYEQIATVFDALKPTAEAWLADRTREKV